ncbi:acetyl-CoA acetyltransferase [Halovivax ruber XH-70]|uniref:Acetyl-CoA acetyltransferase n=1 Tax=Halovivax ruber (strain DSM 18193 / JCM 13892 / XH-70) TaxID=797302 RepID=L0I9X8_HALRX|nr:thiolase family protein [Halovivax ruber]AGB15529.1 acetyl-CoA acetyltransferase [Halovivax ruber XH-70]
MQDAYIVDAVRTPFGKRGGSFRDFHAQDLAATPLEALEDRNDFSQSGYPEDVVYGCVTPIGEQGMNVGRLAPLVAGWGEEIPGVQLNRMCGSGQQAINFAAGQIRGGLADVLVAGGVEHMTRVPMGADSAADADTYAAETGVTETYFEHVDELTTQGEGAERIAEQWDCTRDELDGLAVDSQRRWGQADEAGHYDEQLIAVEVTVDGEERIVERDEHPRPETDRETLGELPLAFREEGEGVVHAGNASGIVDGAAATLIASGEACERYGWDPLARIVDTQVVGVDPITMLTGPIPATAELLERNDLTVDDIDRFEVNEAFASVVAAWLDETGADWERTNVWGGAIAHGHPLGATGAALVGKLPYQLEACDGRYGLSTMCIGFGQGIATLIERV